MPIQEALVQLEHDAPGKSDLIAKQVPILIHDSFLFNNIDDLTKQSFLRLYSCFSGKQIFIALDQFYGKDNEEVNNILYNSTRLVLTGHDMLYGKDWRKSKLETEL